MQRADPNSVLIRGNLAGLWVAKQIYRKASIFQTCKSKRSIMSVPGYDTNIPGAVVPIFEESGNLRGKKATFRCFAQASDNNWTTTLSDAEFRPQICHWHFGLCNILSPFVFDQWECGFQYLPCVSVVLPQNNTSSRNINTKTPKRVPSCKNALRGIADQEKSVRTIAD